MAHEIEHNVAAVAGDIKRNPGAFVGGEFNLACSVQAEAALLRSLRFCFFLSRRRRLRASLARKRGKKQSGTSPNSQTKCSVRCAHGIPSPSKFHSHANPSKPRQTHPEVTRRFPRTKSTEFFAFCPKET